MAESLLFRSRQSLFLITAIIQPAMPQEFFFTHTCETMDVQNDNEIIYGEFKNKLCPEASLQLWKKKEFPSCRKTLRNEQRCGGLKRKK